MERLSKLIRGLRLPGDMITESDLACAAWPQAVGKRIAAHTRAAKLVRRRLVVEVEDQIWQRQLFVLGYHIAVSYTHLDVYKRQFFNLILETQLSAQEKADLVAFMRAL